MFIKDKSLTRVKNILRQHIPEYEVWAFGSRVHGKGLKPFSDLDLVVINKQPLDFHRYALLKEAFTESSLPFRVDLLEWADINDNFRSIIQQNYAVIQAAIDDNC